MARGVGYVSGWPAVYWVAGLGAALLIGAGICYLRSRSFTDGTPEAPGYRSEGRAGAGVAETLRGLAVILALLFAISQLLYVWMYVELAQWLAGSAFPPRIVFDLFFWVLLICGTFLGACIYCAIKPPEI
ncbi:MAG: hypothetical protein HYV09_40800 [Deltaproteobacteria bacterium]|nr:hypothetical protein [Deltaproteobacteria bacterium]